MSTETALAITLCRVPLSDSQIAGVRAMLGDRVDLEELVREAARWQLEPAFFGNLRRHFSGCIPHAALVEATLRETESRARVISRTLVFVELLKKFDVAGIPVIVLKGPAVGMIAYDDFSMRPYGDLDLLVEARNLEIARDFLIGNGLLPVYDLASETALVRDGHALEFSDGRSNVDLHSRLLSRHLRFNLDERELWSQSRVLECAGYRMRVLGTVHLFLFLCAHGTKHEWAHPRWIVDVAQIAQRLTASEVADVSDLARRTHSVRILALGLRLAQALFPDDRTLFKADTLTPEAETRALVGDVESRLRIRQTAAVRRRSRTAQIHPQLGPLLFWVRSREQLRDRVACLALVALTPPSITPGDDRRNKWYIRRVKLAWRLLRATRDS